MSLHHSHALVDILKVDAKISRVKVVVIREHGDGSG